MDGANGVGGIKLKELAAYLPKFIDFEVYNFGSSGSLNYKVIIFV